MYIRLFAGNITRKKFSRNDFFLTLNRVDKKISGLENKIDNVETELKETRAETELKGEIKALDEKIDGVKSELSAKINGVKLGLTAKIDSVVDDVKKLENTVDKFSAVMNIWLTIISAGIVGLFGFLWYIFDKFIK